MKLGEEYTAYVQGHEGIFDALGLMTPSRASLRVQNQAATIGANAYHLCYYLMLFNATNRGEDPVRDWPGSWKIQEFDTTSWRELADRTRQEFIEALQWYDSEAEIMDSNTAIYAVANIAHAAYHLGAMRALLPICK